MRKIVFLLALLFASTVFAQDLSGVEEKINSIVGYAEQYEAGEISYLQLIINAYAIREELKETMGKSKFEMDVEGEHHEGFSREAVEQIFGEPTEVDDWVWVQNLNKEIRVDEPMPRWRKTIFDGRKIQITFNAWPHMLIYGDTRYPFYWADFEIRFKKEYNFDINLIVKAMKERAQAVINGADPKLLAERAFEYRRMLNGYMQQNRENCQQVLENLFSAEEKQSDQKRILWQTFPYQGDYLTLRLEVHSCEDCDWPWVNLWIDAESRDPRYTIPPSAISEKESETTTGDYYEGMGIDALERLIGEKISVLAQEAEKYDHGTQGELPKLLPLYRAQIEAINQHLDMLYYDRTEPEERPDLYAKRLASLEGLLPYEIEKSTFTEIRFEKTLAELKEERQDMHCRHINNIRCKSGEGCYDGLCVQGWGGKEICTNDQDDDFDGLKDCDDPDCIGVDNCLCKRADCSRQLNRECRIMNAQPRSGTEIARLQAFQDGSYVYGAVYIAGMVNSGANYAVNIWNEDKKAWHDFRTEGGEIRANTELGVIDTSSVEWKSGNIIEVKIPIELVGGSGRLYFNARTIDPTTAINYDEAEGVEVTEASVSIEIDGIPNDWYGLPVWDDLVPDSIPKGGRCECVPGTWDCDESWQNGCEASMPCGGCGWHQVMGPDYQCSCEDGWHDCDGNPDDCEAAIPCGERANYICDGRPSDVPCEWKREEETYVCGDKIFFRPCDEVDVCGLNQYFDSDRQACVCEGGWHDCDSDGNCESRGFCGQAQEVCADRQDNDGDSFIDCADRKDCSEGTLCAIGGIGHSECHDGLCVETEICDDGRDNNKDGLVDCQESRCEGVRCGFNENGPLVCAKGECRSPSECFSDDACKPGKCVAGRCKMPRCPDADGDGFKGGECTEDCDDADSGVNPRADEICGDGVDQNCDGADQECEAVKRAVQEGAPCVMVEDCSEGQVCSKGICKRPGAPTPDVRKPREEPTPEPKEEPTPEPKEEPTPKAPGEAPDASPVSPQPAPEEPSKAGTKTVSEPPMAAPGLPMTGFAIADIKCRGDADCGEGRDCDPVWGECHCTYMRFDCNGDGQGNDADGCESEDSTCGGTKDPCAEEECHANQYCNQKAGHCECEDGWQDCDGDWMNGCESQGRDCGEGCRSDADCSHDKCAEWNNQEVMQFGCYAGEKWIETRGEFNMGGGCEFKAQRTEAHIDFNGWGEPFDKVQPIIRELESKEGQEWCQWELENLVKERKELQASLNNDFLKWLFEEYINKDPANWERHIGSNWDIYWKVVNNMREMADRSSCLGNVALPDEIVPIDVEYESPYGHVKIWEERRPTKRGEFGKVKEIYSPFMRIWVFPPKEFIKDHFRRAMEGEQLGGPEGEGPGPSPEEVERIRSNPKAMQAIAQLSDDFGGDFEALLKVEDQGEILLQFLAKVNPEVIFALGPAPDYQGQPDLRVTANFDFVYSMIQDDEMDRGEQTEVPPWEERPRMERFKDVAKGAGKVLRVMAAVATGDLKVEPLSALPRIFSMMGKMEEIMGPRGGTEGEKGSEERPEKQ